MLFLHAGRAVHEPDAMDQPGFVGKVPVGVGLLSGAALGWPFGSSASISQRYRPGPLHPALHDGRVHLLVGLMELCIRTRAQKFILIALLAGMAGGRIPDANPCGIQ